MRNFTFLTIMFCLFGLNNVTNAQSVAITDDDTYNADGSAMLDVKSINKGMLVPRMTTVQRLLISTPATGLLVFDTNEGSFFFYNGTTWANLSSGGDAWTQTGSNLHLADSTNNVGIGTSTPFGKLEVKADASIGINDPIFQVVNNLGDTILAVYNNGVRVNVEDSPAKASGSKGGFAVGGFSPAKAGVTNEYLRVTPDSVRIYIEENSVAKASGSKGGFAVGGFSPAKTNIKDYLSVNSDSIKASKSLYIPRMTTIERDNLGFTPSEALIIFNTTDKCMQIYENSVWSNIWCFNCAPAFIIQPVAQTICSGTNTNFFVSLTGTNLVYQWQQSTDDGTTWSDISNGGASPAYSGATSYSLSLANVPVSFNAYKYRCNVSAACPPGVISSAVVLNVISTPPTITSQPSNQSLSQSCTASFSITSSGYGVTYQWQESPDGTNWSNISNGGSSPVYSGTTSATVSLSNAPLAYNNEQYRCIASNSCGADATSNSATLTVTPITISTQPADVQLSTSCTAIFTVTSSGPSLIYLWQSSPDGTTWSDISNGGSSPAYSNATTASLSLSNVPLSFNNYKYRCIISHSCRPTVTSNPATLTVTPITISTQPVNQQLSDSYTATFSVTSSGPSLIYKWQQSSDNGANWTDITNGGTNPVYSGATLANLSMSSVPPSYNAYKFRCIISHFCRPSVTSDAATLIISLPTLTTTAVSGIQSTQATSGGNISSNGGAAVTARGVCWSTSANPTIADNFTSNGTGTGIFISNITGLTLGITYYVRAYSINAIGTAYGNEVSFITTLDVGESYQGGIIVYILQSGDPGYIVGETHGLIAALNDQSSAEWGCYGTTISGADGTAIGTGSQNTIDIEAGCTTAGTAADIAANLVLNGYDDWFLPSTGELNKLYLNKTAIGGFSNGYYWSSSEFDATNAWIQDFDSGGQNFIDKYFNYYVRCVRSF